MKKTGSSWERKIKVKKLQMRGNTRAKAEIRKVSRHSNIRRLENTEKTENNRESDQQIGKDKSRENGIE